MKYENLLKRVISSLKCSVCGSQYEVDNINVLGHQDELWFLSVFCPSCNSNGLVAAVVKEGSKVEVISDFTGDEYAEFKNMNAICADDVIDMHSFLKDFDGDFTRLLADKLDR